MTKTILIAGASGATGIRLVEELLNRGHRVRAIVRSKERVPVRLQNHDGLTLIIGSILEMSAQEIQEAVIGCEAVVSCLGHNLTLKGVFGKPRRLVTDATKLLCHAIKANPAEKACKYILMNTVTNRNRDLNEAQTSKEKLVISFLRLLLPPHSDNEQAAEFLRTHIGQNDNLIHWVAVRPSGLIDEDTVSEIEAFESPQRSFLNDGQISRINVGYFMADLITDHELWMKWKGKMPVIYNNNQELGSKN